MSRRQSWIRVVSRIVQQSFLDMIWVERLLKKTKPFIFIRLVLRLRCKVSVIK